MRVTARCSAWGWRERGGIRPAAGGVGAAPLGRVSSPFFFSDAAQVFDHVSTQKSEVKVGNRTTQS